MRKKIAVLLKTLVREEDGNVSLIVAGGIVTFLLLISLVSDVGLLFVKQQKLQNALDAGVLAGIQEVIYSEASAEEQTRTYVQQNGGGLIGVEADDDDLSIEATGEETVPLWFAKVVGFDQTTVKARAHAKAGTVVGMNGLIPIAVPDQTFLYGSLYELTEGAGDGSSGNYGFLDFSGGGAINLAENIRNGYEGRFDVGDKIPTETGVNHGPVGSAIDDRINLDEGISDCQSYQTATRTCNRIVFLPVIDSLNVNGEKPVTIVGFAAFFLEGTSRQGGHMVLEGRFLRMVAPGEMGSGNNYGVYTVKLTP